MNTDFNFRMVGGGNENGYGQQYGVRVALVGQKSGRRRNGALAASNDELSLRRADRGAPVTPRYSLIPQVLGKRSPEVDDCCICPSGDATSQKDRSQRADNGKSQYDDCGGKVPL